jgi:hypothetical protein
MTKTPLDLLIDLHAQGGAIIRDCDAASAGELLDAKEAGRWAGYMHNAGYIRRTDAWLHDRRLRASGIAAALAEASANDRALNETQRGIIERQAAELADLRKEVEGLREAAADLWRQKRAHVEQDERAEAIRDADRLQLSAYHRTAIKHEQRAGRYRAQIREAHALLDARGVPVGDLLARLAVSVVSGGYSDKALRLLDALRAALKEDA